MVEINNTPVKLNQIVTIGYLNERNCYEIISGRVYNWSDRSVSLDVSYDFTSLLDTVRVRLDRVKYCRVTIDNMYR